MAGNAPPTRVRNIRPTLVNLPAETTTWRVQLRRYPDVFNSRPHVEPFYGGRFDSNQSFRYPFSYLGQDRETALVERLLRDLAYRHGGDRLLPRSTVNGRRLRAVRTMRPIKLLSLCSGADLSGVYADEWLIHSEPVNYPMTRAWAHWLREQVPEAEGFIWPSRLNVGGTAIILFGDQCRGAVQWHDSEPAIELDDDAGTAWLNDVLRPYRVTVRPPRRGKPTDE
jgi:hypothetical protein